jgi:hypothetical protein
MRRTRVPEATTSLNGCVVVLTAQQQQNSRRFTHRERRQLRWVKLIATPIALVIIAVIEKL